MKACLRPVLVLRFLALSFPVCMALAGSHSVMGKSHSAPLLLDKIIVGTGMEAYRIAAEQGDIDAQLKLWEKFYQGDGVAKDLREAQKWLRKAAERGDAESQAKLGAMYYLGEGEPKDTTEALRWFQAAAAQGDAYAQGCLGVMYALGDGVPQNPTHGCAWLFLAAAGGNEMAVQNLEKVKQILTPSQLEEAQHLAMIVCEAIPPK